MIHAHLIQNIEPFDTKTSTPSLPHTKRKGFDSLIHSTKQTTNYWTRGPVVSIRASRSTFIHHRRQYLHILYTPPSSRFSPKQRNIENTSICHGCRASLDSLFLVRFCSCNSLGTWVHPKNAYREHWGDHEWCIYIKGQLCLELIFRSSQPLIGSLLHWWSMDALQFIKRQNKIRT